MADKIADELDNLNDDRAVAVAESNKAYNDAIAANNQLATDTENKLNDMKDLQTKVQNEQTKFAIDKIEQEKEWAEKDYQKEQRGAYRDYQKQINPYGVNAEQMASMGLSNSGYSESSKVAMYTAYQNRVATARESFQRASTEFTNQITQARLQNSAALAEIAIATLEKSLEYSIQFASKNNELMLAKAQDNKKNSYSFSSGGGGNGGKNSGKKINSGIATFQQKVADNIKAMTGNKEDKKEDKKEPTPSMGSVLDLGLGPISAKKLDELVTSGKVVETPAKNNKLKFGWRFNGK